MKPGKEIQADSLVFTVLSAHYALSHFCALPPIAPLPLQCHHHPPSLQDKILFILQNQFNILGSMHQKENAGQKQLKILTWAGYSLHHSILNYKNRDNVLLSYSFY